MSRNVRQISASESERLHRSNIEMEQRLIEVKRLFEKEKTKREREALNWASSAGLGDGSIGQRGVKNSRSKGALDSQSRKILGKGYDRNLKFKVLKDKPLDVPKRPADQEMANFIASEKARLAAEVKQTKRRVSNSNAPQASYPPLTRSPPKRSPFGSANRRSPKSLEPVEEYILFSDSQNSEIYELPLTREGDLDLNTVKTVASARTVGVYTIREGRKRLMPCDPSTGRVIRPASGWKQCTYYPLIPPRSSRPGTARSQVPQSQSGQTSLSTSAEFSLKPLSPSFSGPTGFTPRNVESLPVVPIGQETSLLHGTYDEEAAAREFQQAVAEFRGDRRVTPRADYHKPTFSARSSKSGEVGTGEEMPALPHEVPIEKKLDELEKMFEQKTNITAVERIYLEQARSASRMIAASQEFGEEEAPENNDDDDDDDRFKTEEDYELEEDRNELREMLLDSISSHSLNVEKPKEHPVLIEEKGAAAPLEVVIEKQLTPRPPSAPKPSQNRRKPSPRALKVSDYEPMWMPTPGVNFDNDVESRVSMDSLEDNDELQAITVASSNTSVEEIHRPELQSRFDEQLLSPEERIFQETVHQTIYSDGTVVNNVVTVELSHDEYNAENDYDFEHDNEWQEELLRQQEQELFDAHSRRFSEQMTSQPNGEHEAPRPASRSSIYTDDDLADNFDMTSQLNEIESRYLPDDDDY
ncbi:Oidioi.mRNA.OKI2018_I69.chr2.g4585.t1.cds [Oikopleura dioica]|uniref:Oidioi.mRNA.OKI2018_I69.chr2.g4585.t1.cds n=1 Tax=Oikopleura dioica TaxID=34765 RepID=A0ABN7SZD8_OIKDI|nr:Oidioi.mRNA.OKI2018_I69.chr2.g4585.t1.cds [Oikopleura dioica]